MADEEQVTPDERELSLDDDIETAPDEGFTVDDEDASDKEAIRVKEAQKKMHEATQRASDLEKQVEKMSGQITTLTELVGKRGEPAPQLPQENPFDFLEDEKLKESLLDSSDNVIGVMKRVIGEFGRTLSMRDRMLLQELNQRDPEIRSAVDQIKAFREENPEFEDLSDQQVIKVMKKMGGKPEQPKKRVLTIGSRTTAESPEQDEFQKEAKMWYDRIGYSRYDELDKRRKK